MDKIVKWMVIYFVFYYTLDSIYRQKTADPFMNSGKVPYFRDNYHRPRNWFLETSAPALALTTRRSWERSRGHHHHHQYPIACPWRGRLQPWTLSSGEFNLPKIPFTLQDRWQHNIDKFYFPAKMHYDMILFVQLVTSFEGCCLRKISTWFYAEDKNL